MIPARVKSLLPRSLFGRALAILMVPIVVLQLIVGLIFFERHYQRVTAQLTRGVALELSLALDRIEAGPTDARKAALGEVARALEMDLAFRDGAALTPSIARDITDFSGLALVRTLRAEIAQPLAVDLVSRPGMARIAIATDAGVLEAAVARTRMSVSNPHQLLVLMVFAAALLTATAVLFLRNQVRPIRALAEAAEGFGKGRTLPFRPAGAEEVRRAGAAFLSMRARIERQIEQRTQMLSGVSHDLRTPLTRMKLTLAMLEAGDETADLRQDVDQMQRMLDAFLAFARGDTLEESTPTDPFDLARAVVEQSRRAGTEIALVPVNETPQDPRVAMRPMGIGRALQNLIDNGARHGERVVVQVRLLPKTLDFIVEDDGPGIAPEDRLRASQPFARLDVARNQDHGDGVGLGLSIATDVARTHGGSLELGQSLELGGLRATLRIPR